MATYFTVAGAELREASGEAFSTVVQSGTLTIKGSPAVLEVDGHVINLEKSSREPFKRIGRDFKMATSDIMSFYYISLPPGLQDAVYNRFEELLTLMQEGKPLPLPKPAEAAAAAAAAGPAAEGSSTGAAGGQTQGKGMFDQLKELGAKAAQDTMAVAAAIKAKAEHDIAALQEQQQAKKAAEQGA